MLNMNVKCYTFIKVKQKVVYPGRSDLIHNATY